MSAIGVSFDNYHAQNLGRRNVPRARNGCHWCGAERASKLCRCNQCGLTPARADELLAATRRESQLNDYEERTYETEFDGWCGTRRREG